MQRLLRLRQGNVSVAEYSINFRILAADGSWNKLALFACFHEGLRPEIQLELAYKDTGMILSSCISLAIKLDQHLCSQGRLGHANPPDNDKATRDLHCRTLQAHTLVRLSSHCLSPWTSVYRACPREREWWSANGLCLYCRELDHRHCPRRQVSHLTPPKDTQPFSILAQLHYKNLSLSVSSGLAGNFISQSVVSLLLVPVSKLPVPIRVSALDGCALAQFPIAHITYPILLTFPGHAEELQFYLRAPQSAPSRRVKDPMAKTS